MFVSIFYSNPTKPHNRNDDMMTQKAAWNLCMRCSEFYIWKDDDYTKTIKTALFLFKWLF